MTASRSRDGPQITRLCCPTTGLGRNQTDEGARRIFVFVRVLRSGQVARLNRRRKVSPPPGTTTPPSSPSTVTEQVWRVEGMTTTGRLRGTVPGPATPLGHHPTPSPRANRIGNGTLHPPPHARVVRELVVHRRAELLLGHAPRQLGQLAERRPFPRGVLLEFFLRAVGLVQDAPVQKSGFHGAFVLHRRFDLHAIDATPARWRGDAGSSPLDRARTVAPSLRNDLVKNHCRVHPTHWLISTQASSTAASQARTFFPFTRTW